MYLVLRILGEFMGSGFSIDFNTVDQSYRTRRGLERYNNDYRSRYSGNSIYTNRQKSVQDVYVSSGGNTCTDGKDDGHIGLFEGIGSLIKGVGSGIGKMVTGAFLDENGKFSPLKTLKTAAIVATCFACPAVAFGLSAYGIATSGYKIINSVVQAHNATTDAEKKDALESVGEGGLTLGLSIWGAKTSAKAISGGKVYTGNALQKTGNFLKDVFKQGKDGMQAFWKAPVAYGWNKISNITSKFGWNKFSNFASKHAGNITKSLENNTTYLRFGDLTTYAKNTLGDIQRTLKPNSATSANQIMVNNASTQGAAVNSTPSRYIGENALSTQVNPNWTYAQNQTYINSTNYGSYISKASSTLLSNSGSFLSRLSDVGKLIFNEISSGTSNINSLAREYGWTNVNEVLSLMKIYSDGSTLI